MERRYEYIKTIEATLSTGDFLVVSELLAISNVTAMLTGLETKVACSIKGANTIMIDGLGILDIPVTFYIKGS